MKNPGFTEISFAMTINQRCQHWFCVTSTGNLLMREACEDCLLSYEKKDPCQEMYKFLASRLGWECLKKPLNGMDYGSSTGICSCCSKPWRSRTNVHKIVQSRPIAKPDVPLPKSPGRRSLNRQEGVNKKNNRVLVEYKEVNIISDSDFEFPFSNEEDVRPLPRDLGQQDSRVKHYEDASCKSANMMNNHMHFSPMSKKLEISVPSLEQMKNRQKALPELGSLDDISLSSNSPASSPIPFTNEGDKVFYKNVLPSKNVQLPSRLSRESRADRNENDDIEHTPASANLESVDFNSTRKVDVSIPNTSTIKKDVCSEKLGPNEETTTAKIPTLFADHTSLNIKNMILTGHADVVLSSMIEPPIRTRSPNIFSLESLESFTEIEGENLMDKLKHQAEHYKKCMTKLYKELQEERNAATISANQAMAMITKLQEEKAALNMEAGQYLRMMDEQAEYDVDELERANDLVAEKEKELQDLEAELDYFRIKYPDDFPEIMDMQSDIVDEGGALTLNLESIDEEES